MPIIKRRLDICGREKSWEYSIESGGRQFRVWVRQVGKGEPEFQCSCGYSTEPRSDDLFYVDAYPFNQPCAHVAEAQRDLAIARQAAAQMIP